ncbi:MAG: hypothetical protein VX733_01250 [Candidatus Latescibacterota bacterium]|nr:hypothetical protein [Candidatus Latescibacterota bacterium]
MPAGRRNATEQFITSIRSGELPYGQTDLEISHSTQQVVEAGLRSATSGVEVSLQ